MEKEVKVPVWVEHDEEETGKKSFTQDEIDFLTKYRVELGLDEDEKLVVSTMESLYDCGCHVGVCPDCGGLDTHGVCLYYSPDWYVKTVCTCFGYDESDAYDGWCHYYINDDGERIEINTKDY